MARTAANVAYCPPSTVDAGWARPGEAEIMVSRVLKVLAVVFVVAVIAASCGGSNKKSSSNNGGTVVGSNNTVAGGGTATTVPQPVTKQINQTVNFAGFAITVIDAKFTPTPASSFSPTSTTTLNPGTLDLDLSLKNLTPTSLTPQGEWSVETKGASKPPSDLSSLQEIPGEGKAPGKISATLDDFSMDDAVVTFGAATTNQAKVPLGTTGEVVSYAPTTQAISGSATSGDVTIKLTKAETRVFGPGSGYRQADAGKVYILLTGQATTSSASGYAFSGDNLTLTLPDGTAVTATDTQTSKGSCCAVIDANAPLGFTTMYVTVDPPQGKYTASVVNGTSNPKGSIPFTLTGGSSTTTTTTGGGSSGSTATTTAG